jgi:hypothetical protein
MATLGLVLVADTPKPAPAKPQAGAAPAPAAAVAAPPTPGALKPFADVIKEAKETKGLFPLWQKDDKVWIEVSPEQLQKPFFFTYNIVQGLGERGLYGGMMGGSHVVYFKRVANNLQLLARNTDFMAQDGTPMARAVAEGFSDSLLGNSAVLSQPHPERKTFLVEANPFFLKDLPMGATQLEFAFRQPYGFDAANSSFVKLNGTPDMTGFQVNGHYSLAKLMLPPMPMPGAPPMPFTPPPRTLEDVRSLFIGYYYTLAKLPPQPMAVRRADDRVGHFVTTRWDWTTDMHEDERIRLVHRWRLEKADPAVALSKPKDPIVYWMDRNIPERYRDTVKAGILEWNKAFEAIGFKDAIEVKQQPDDADWSTHDSRHASIRWFVGTDAGFAIGPSVVDPRSGEILDADIGMSDIFTRGDRREFREELPSAAPLFRKDAQHACTYLAEAALEADFAADLLEARGEFEPGSPAEEAFVLGYLKDVVMHEVGHTLGLRHNFRASTLYSPEQLGDKAFTTAKGITGSVMDYTPTNIAGKGKSQGAYHMTTLGPYDYWAIEYAYRPVDPAAEKTELAKIAARGEREPLLAYATDEEAGGFGGLQGMDPEVNRFDLGKDPLQYLGTRIELSRELLERLQDRTFKPGDDFTKLRRGVNIALGRMNMASSNAAKYLGGVVYLRDHAGSTRTPLTPVSGARQREALKLLEKGIFDMNAFRFKPEFMARLTVNQFDRLSSMNVAPDFSLAGAILGMQRSVLGQVLQPVILRRILDAPDKLQDPKTAFRLGELFEGIHSAIWAELKAGKEPAGVRRSLQKEHLRQLVGMVLRANPATPDDARALAREGLKGLGAQLRAASTKPGFSRESKAHFAECLASIEETLKASVQRVSI